MNWNRFRTILLENWLLMTGAALVGVVLAGVISLVIPPRYSSTSQLFVSARGDTSRLDQLSQGGTFSSERVKSYAELARSPLVLDSVKQVLQSSESVADLQGLVSADAPTDTVIVEVTAEGPSSDAAVRLSDATVTQLARTVEAIEAPSPGQPSPIRATVVAPAQTPSSPDWPRIPVNLVVGALLGLAIGLSVGVVRDALTDTVRGRVGLEALGLSAVAGIGTSVDEATLVVRDNPRSRTAEEFRKLRTGLDFAAVDKAAKSIVVTSCKAGEGKSYVTLNLALALAEMGRRVCLVDADLRRPTVAERLGVAEQPGLTTAIVGRIPLPQALQRVNGNMWVLPAGELPPNPSELLGSERAQGVLQELQGFVDIVLIDSPPVLPVADSTVLASRADAVLVVVQDRSTRNEDLRTLQVALSSVDARILGVVLNRVHLSSREDSAYDYAPSRSVENVDRSDVTDTHIKPSPTRRR
ncbi:polysaccharide biosynthesis tyrosine autokinase [Actinomycetospora sp. CA-084318]|uniref:polysaccharide biosynthesis tyrosine autokinase n=1 Tax=Actinomycetospora sp. CA-084318 TaxID=3239892 RepID=UPI003D974922